MLIELQWKKARPFIGQDPSLSRNTSRVWLGPRKCPGCSRAAEDSPWSEPFQKYFVCSKGNQFAIQKSSKICHGGWWEWLDMASFFFFLLISPLQSGIAEMCSLYKEESFFEHMSLFS